MKVIAMRIVMMGDAFKMKQFVLLTIFISNQRSKSSKSQRLPACANNKARGDYESNHARKHTIRVCSSPNLLCLMCSLPRGHGPFFQLICDT